MERLTQIEMMWRHDSYHNDSQNNDTQHNGTQLKVLICDTLHSIALHYADYNYAECRVLFKVMPIVIMMSVVGLSVVVPLTLSQNKLD
jgi:hypothetical protein